MSFNQEPSSVPTERALVERDPGQQTRVAGPALSIGSVIDKLAVRAVFQPVVHLASGSVVGFEALTRGPADSPLESPLALLSAAKQARRLGELDWLCRTQAMQAAADAGLPESLSWFINVEPAGLGMPCPAHLAPALNRARAELRVILEVVERELEGNALDLIRATDEARTDSWGVALDDVGAEESSLALLPFLRPDVVKLDMSLIQQAPRAAAAAITAAVRSYAERAGAVILAEGIETQAQEQLARVFGATYGQGYYYGKPGALPTSVPTPSHPIPLRQYLRPLDGRTPYEVLAAKIEPQREEKRHLLHISAHLEDQAAQGSHASVLLAGFQNSSFFTSAKQALYRQLSNVNALTLVLAADLPHLDGPHFHAGPLSEGSRLTEEWVVIVLNPHYAAAFVARDCGDAGPDQQRRFDFIYTHDRESVIDAARCYVQEMTARSPLGDRQEARTLSTDHKRQSPLNRSAGNARELRGRESAEPGGDGTGTSVTNILDVAGGASGFRAAAQVVLAYLNTSMPMGFWSITRRENERQTFLYVDDNEYGAAVGGGHPWDDSYCVHMVAGTGPRIAPDAASVPVYAAAAINETLQIGAYAGVPIAEPDGSLFGAICGLDRVARQEIASFGPVLDVLAELLTLALAGDRALHDAEIASRTVLSFATTDVLTGAHNRNSWDERITQLDVDFATYADPTVIVVIDLDNLQQTNNGPGGRAAGDALLRAAADVLRRHIRDQDFLARLDGDQFGIILMSCEASLAPTLANRLAVAMDRAAIPASVGWAALRPAATVHHAIDLADRAMSDAKERRKSTRPANAP